ncbi:2-oxo acid dehydrogenase subunit E2 [Georgenia sp. TF02-10]|uniref:dihydrolipoamide acetyltransferase family protein n=1 Tax=Georgenia sp. TF02-10 TaxID=2917725 RepID=UPI001FA7EA7A|nr:dihydrolipoamide acetyltransferase family protein [Georgenia sp. TF02-10]UNX54707.1 2-oxo acid dehydrogenase subunit E2 [Georgenia sp. TF02-10]
MPSYQQFRLPDVGEGLTEADIVAWSVAVGDTVEVDQQLCEIETAKSVVELPSPFAGVVHELVAPEGATVPVGSPIIVIDVDPGGAPSDDGGARGAAGSEPAANGQRGQAAPGGPGEASAGEAAAGEAAQVVAEVGEVAAETAAAAGAAGEGASAGQGQAATAPDSSGSVLVGYGTRPGAAARRRRRPGGPAPAGAPAPAAPSAGAPVPAPQAAAPAPAASPAASPAPAAPAPAAPAPARALAKPPVRKLAKDLGVDLEAVVGTGPGGLVTREDVEAFRPGAEAAVEPGTPTTADEERPWLAGGTVSADGRQTRVPAKAVRRRTAEAMVASAFTAPHVTVFQTVDVTRTVRLVERLRSDREFAGVHVTPLLVVMKAFLLAIRRHPEVNASWDDDAKEIVYKHYVNLGIAAETPRGLLVPNIKDAHRLNLRELAAALGDLVSTARAGRTPPAAMADGTVTITNIGMFGTDAGTPILNPGESAILAVGTIAKRPWVHHDQVKPRHVAQLALSFDHRLVDGALGCMVLADVARVLQDPAQGLVWG